MKLERHIFLLFLILSFFLHGCATRTTIINSVSERDANEIIVLLSAHGIDAQKVAAPVAAGAGATTEQLWDISVPSEKITEALGILNQAGLPRVKGTKLLDLFGAQGLVPSDLQDRIRYQEGLSEQLASTIRKMDGIVDANVQITFPQDEETKTLTASVYVKHRGVLDNPNSLLITKIKRLVASAIPGLTIENVTVVADRALYSDITLDQTDLADKQYVSIWSVILAKESAGRFRLIFYTFLILLFLLLSLLGWLLWKCLPIIQQQGGLKALFSPSQYVLKKEEVVEEENIVETEEGNE